MRSSKIQSRDEQRSHRLSDDTESHVFIVYQNISMLVVYSIRPCEDLKIRRLTERVSVS